MLALDEDAGYYYVLNETSSRVWELIAEPASVEAVCERLCQEFSVDADTCLREVLHLLHGLHKAGLIKLVNDVIARNPNGVTKQSPPDKRKIDKPCAE